MPQCNKINFDIFTPKEFYEVFPQGTNHLHIIGDVQITDQKHRILLLGLNYIPLQHTPDYVVKLKAEFQDYTNRLRWKDFWSCNIGDPTPPLFNKKAHVNIGPSNNKLDPGLVSYIHRTTITFNKWIKSVQPNPDILIETPSGNSPTAFTSSNQLTKTSAPVSYQWLSTTKK